MRRPGHIAVAVLAMLLLSATPASASRSMGSMFEDHNALVRTSPERRQAMLEELRNRMGADTLRIEVKWNQVAPDPSARTKPRFEASDPGAYQGSPNAYPGFGPFDDLVRPDFQRDALQRRDARKGFADFVG